MSCRHCDEPFWARNPRQLYCSARCRTAYCVQSKRAEREQWQAKHWLPDPLPAPPPWPHHEVPVAIVAHPDRAEGLDELVLQTTAEAVVLDDRNYGCGVNHLRAWEWLGGGNCPWSVVIEDDAVPVERFRFQLHAALQAARTPIVSLYLGRSRPPLWQDSIAQAVGATRLADACFLTCRALLHAVGYAVRTDLIPSLLEEVTHLVRTRPIDEAITLWADRHGHMVSYTWPSLLDHADGPTLVEHPDGQPRSPGRVAWCADWRQRWEPTFAPIPLPLRRVG